MKRLLAILLLLPLVIAALRTSRRSAYALPQDVKVISAACSSNPEVTVIQNQGQLAINLAGYAISSVAAIGTAVPVGAPPPYYPLPPGLSLDPGQQLSFHSGPAAPPSAASMFTLTRTYVYNRSLARTGAEGAVLSFNGQPVSAVACSETTPQTVTPTPPSEQAPASTPAASTPFPQMTAFAPSTRIPSPVTTPATTPGGVFATATAAPFGAGPAGSTPIVTGTCAGRPPGAGPCTTTPTPGAAATPGSGLSCMPGGPQGMPIGPGCPHTSYPPGWNLVGSGDGTHFAGATILLAISRDGRSYRSVDAGAPAVAGQAYWAYFPAEASVNPVALSPVGARPLSLPVAAGSWTFVGNPTLDTAAVSGADLVYAFDPRWGYVPVTAIAPGQAVVVYAVRDATVVVSAAGNQDTAGADHDLLP